jgi:hypothetical protein
MAIQTNCMIELGKNCYNWLFLKGLWVPCMEFRDFGFATMIPICNWIFWDFFGGWQIQRARLECLIVNLPSYNFMSLFFPLNFFVQCFSFLLSFGYFCYFLLLLLLSITFCYFCYSLLFFIEHCYVFFSVNFYYFC